MLFRTDLCLKTWAEKIRKSHNSIYESRLKCNHGHHHKNWVWYFTNSDLIWKPLCKYQAILYFSNMMYQMYFYEQSKFHNAFYNVSNKVSISVKLSKYLMFLFSHTFNFVWKTNHAFPLNLLLHPFIGPHK